MSREVAMQELNLLTADELARALRVSPAAIRSWTRKGLPARRFGRCVRFSLEEALHWFEGRQQRNDHKLTESDEAIAMPGADTRPMKPKTEALLTKGLLELLTLLRHTNKQ